MLLLFRRKRGGEGLESWTSVAIRERLRLRLLLFIQFSVAGRVIVIAGAQCGPAAGAGQNQMPHLTNDGSRIVCLLQYKQFHFSTSTPICL